MNTRLIYTAVLVFFIASGWICADGIIIIDPHQRPVPRPGYRPAPYTPLSVQSHKVDISIDDNIARTTIDEVFYNPNNAVLEGTFIFPLPERAAISKFSLFIDGKETQGEVLAKDKARTIYEDIVRKMKDPALLEYVGRDMFKARVYPIPARGTRRVKLSYSETVKADSGLYSYTYPLNTEKFSSQPLQEVLVHAELNTDRPLKNVYCPTHSAEVKRLHQTRAKLVYEAHNVLPDKDFSIFYSVEGDKFGLSLASFRQGTSDGYFISMVSPSFEETETHIKKDVAFVFDTSGSMQGKKIEQAKNALKFCLNSLREGDRFALVSFATEAQSFKKTLAECSGKNIDEALGFVDGLQARGGTNISDALETALSMDSGEKRPYIIVFMTDGKPTLGIQDEKELVQAVSQHNKHKARVFVFGVGFNVNTHILDRIAEDAKGARSYVTPEEDIEIKISNFFTKVESPALTDVKVSFTGVDTYDVYPGTLPDLFRGSQLEIMGRYRKGQNSAIVLKGNINGKTKEYVFEKDFSGRTAAGETIPKLWATRKIFFLLDEIRLHGMKTELKDEIVRLSKEFGIMTPYTSYLVLDDERKLAEAPALSAGGAIRRYRDSAVREEKKEALQHASDIILGKMKSGEGAANASKAMADKKQDGRYEEADEVFRGKDNRKLIKTAGNRTFYFNGDVWIDSRFNGKKDTVKIEYMSEGYFEFLKKHPSCGRFLALGSRVIFECEGTFYEITDSVR